jgi:hypothetical protein
MSKDPLLMILCYGEEWYLSFIKMLSVSMKERIIPMLSV